MGVREHRQRRLADKIVIVLGDPETHKTENYNINTHATIALFYANICIMNVRIYPYLIDLGFMTLEVRVQHCCLKQNVRHKIVMQCGCIAGASWGASLVHHGCIRHHGAS